jgi:hypothetical protein
MMGIGLVGPIARSILHASDIDKISEYVSYLSYKALLWFFFLFFFLFPFFVFFVFYFGSTCIYTTNTGYMYICILQNVDFIMYIVYIHTKNPELNVNYRYHSSIYKHCPD